MSDLRFAEPQWIHLIWLVLAFVAVLMGLDQRGSRGLDRFLSTIMQQRLVSRPKRSRRLLRIALLGFAGVFLVLALMRPQSGFQSVSTPRVGAQIMICLDVSKSMLAEDVAPNRLDRSKAEIQDLLAYLGRDHVGLIAFAGKATVLCPLTPDFGFLRLRLQSANPDIVGRGGTNLETPIRKALAGFRGQSDLSRAIILITDGDDHDSFAAEAAKAASERGIRIISIGFGDEAGSQVQLTDKRTGARTTLLDGNDDPVVTHLNGELLRKIALETDGAYIPAATGALDLKSIYEAHIAPLTRGRLDDRGRLVKQEQYQWAVLLALVCLVASSTVVLGRAAPQTQPVGSPAGSIVAAVVMASLLAGSPLRADQTVQQTDEPEVLDGSADESTSSEADDEPDQIDPRQAYNDALAMFHNNKLDEAESGFSQARMAAASDGPARYRCTYNLGWVEIEQANKLIKDQPEQALRHLHAAADWFRDAVRLQPDEVAPRENLEIVTRRAIALADTLNRQDEQDLTAQLDELIQQQRQLVGQLQDTVRRVASLDQAIIPDHLRGEFRSLEVEQRKTLAALGEISQRAREEADGLAETPEDQRTAEGGLRIAQLANVQAFLYEAGQRLGQTRRHLRGRQAERAYRRASAALGQLKRARDQLRDLVQVLGAVVADASKLTRQTADFAEANRQTPGVAQSQPPAPKWLTRQFLEQTLTTTRDRTDELVARVESGMANVKTESDDAQSPKPPGSSQSQGPTDPSESIAHKEHLLAILSEAAPLIRGARDAFDQANQAFSSQQDHEAYQSEARATAQLLKAHELFLDVRGLIERMYADQKKIQTLVGLDEMSDTTISEYSPMLGQLQSDNMKRGERLDGLLGQKLDGLVTQEAQVDATAPPTGGSESDVNAQPQQQQQLQLAKQLLGLAMATFRNVENRVGQMEGPLAGADLDQLRVKVDESVEQLETLRRLFFSIVEHLREMLRRQVELSDETRDVTTLTEADQIQKQIGPLSLRQQELSSISQQIAESLKIQSEQPVPDQGEGPGEPQDQTTAAESQDVAHRMLEASKRVSEAKDAMDQSIEQMNGEPMDLKATQEHQGTAAQMLAEAIRLLASPPPPQEDQQQNQDEQQQQGDQEQKEDQAQPSPQRMDLNQLLQAVRDREAQRQRDKRRRQPSGYVPVEKDW